MSRSRGLARRAVTGISFLTAYAGAASPSTDNIVIPEDLSSLSDDDLTTLSGQVSTAFNDLYAGGETDLSEDDLGVLGTLAEGIKVLGAESEARLAASQERRTRAADLAAQVNPPDESEQDPDDPSSTTDEAEQRAAQADPDDPTPEDPATGEPVPGESEEEPNEDDEEQPGAVTASAKKQRKGMVITGLKSRSHRTLPQRPASQRDLMFAAPDLPGFANGQAVDLDDLGRALDTRMRGFSPVAFAQAAQQGRVLRQQFSVASIRKPIPDDLRVMSDDPALVKAAMDRAVDQSRLQGGSLVASGGWAAPSETLYDLFTPLESNDGLVSLPEIGVTRGGIKFTVGPDYSEIYGETGFTYTEAQDESGADYPKPTYHVGSPAFEEERLNLAGVAITAGLLEKRGYPEMIARVIAGALVAHAHRINAALLSGQESASTAVSLTAGQIGSAAPVLSAIELQVEHYRHFHRMSRNATLEAVFPFWVRGAIRSDLSRRLGVPPGDTFGVTDAQITAWFTQRGIAPQFVYDWQDIASTAASGFVQWPTSVKFLLYAAGTWVKGSSDVVTLDTIYDSTLLGTNDYTALFTEEGYLLAKRGPDSRVVTVPIASTGQTAAGVTIANSGAGA